jgi:hypothetical protein
MRSERAEVLDEVGGVRESQAAAVPSLALSSSLRSKALLRRVYEA